MVLMMMMMAVLKKSENIVDIGSYDNNSDYILCCDDSTENLFIEHIPQ